MSINFQNSDTIVTYFITNQLIQEELDKIFYYIYYVEFQVE